MRGTAIFLADGVVDKVGNDCARYARICNFSDWRVWLLIFGVAVDSRAGSIRDGANGFGSDPGRFARRPRSPASQDCNEPDCNEPEFPICGPSPARSHGIERAGRAPNQLLTPLRRVDKGLAREVPGGRRHCTSLLPTRVLPSRTFLNASSRTIDRVLALFLWYKAGTSDR